MLEEDRCPTAETAWTTSTPSGSGSFLKNEKIRQMTALNWVFHQFCGKLSKMKNLMKVVEAASWKTRIVVLGFFFICLFSFVYFPYSIWTFISLFYYDFFSNFFQLFFFSMFFFPVLFNFVSISFQFFFSFDRGFWI